MAKTLLTSAWPGTFRVITLIDVSMTFDPAERLTQPVVRVEFGRGQAIPWSPGSPGSSEH